MRTASSKLMRQSVMIAVMMPKAMGGVTMLNSPGNVAVKVFDMRDVAVK